MPRLLATTCLFAVLVIAFRAQGSGLLTPTDETLPPLRVTDHLVDVEIHDRIALTNLTQKFRNDTGRRLEATYIFPLPEDADLTDFQMSFNGKMVKGEVLPAEEAAQIYESIVRRRRDPGLIEFIGRRLLRMRVFPIEPESETTIQVRYQQVCRPISGMTGYHYPLRTRKTAGQAYGTVRFAVELDTNAPLKNIWSPTHAVEIVRKGEHRAVIAYEASGASLEDDFLVLWGTDSSDLGLSVVAHRPDDDEAGHFVLMLTPKQLWPQQDSQPQDVVFVLDTSGSMSGDKLAQAKAALKFCIDNLDQRDRFSIVRFSSGFDVLHDSVAEATAERRKEAKQWVEQFSAAGGTNISDTLVHVLTMQPATTVERPFVVVFLTDGMGNRKPDDILAALKKQAGGERVSGVRIFPFGVGHDVNTKLLDRLAEDYTGRVTYVQPGENLELVLGDFFSVISRPVLTNLKLTLPEAGVTERFPATLGDLYHGQQLIIAGRFASDARGMVKLTATRNGEPVEYAWGDIAFEHARGAGYVPSVWAGRKIAYLLDQIRLHGESQEMIDEIIALSQDHGIQTPYTSWLVTPEGEREQLVRFGVPALRVPGAPASRVRSGGGGGFGGGGGDLSVRQQQSALERAAPGIAIDGPVDGLSDAGQDLLFIEGDAVQAESGEIATELAKRSARMRVGVSRDEQRIDRNLLAAQKIGSRRYNRIGRYLVDEALDEKTEILKVRFGSSAYFELVRGRADLRKALAAAPTVAVMVDDATAVLVLEESGLEEFSDEQRKKVGVGIG